MHYYKRDIGKYYKKAGRLTMLQHGAYTMLMDACYDREVFPTLEQAIDWCWASSSEEIDAVKFVLSKFFTEYDGEFKQAHITETLDKYHENAATNKAIAVKREADRRTKREQTVDGSTTNEHLITNKELGITNNQLITKDQKTRASPFIPPSANNIHSYCLEKSINGIDPESFIDFYESKGWMVGKNKMKDWKAAVRTWAKRNKEENNNGSHKQTNKPSLAERLEANRKRAEQQSDEQPMGEDGLYLRS